VPEFFYTDDLQIVACVVSTQGDSQRVTAGETDRRSTRSNTEHLRSKLR